MQVIETLTMEAWFIPGSVHVGYVVDKMALAQVFPLSTLIFPVNIIPLWLSILIYYLGDKK
jgi:hypothetical protein